MAELEQGPDPGQVVEPRTGDLRAAVGVDRAEELTQLQVVSRLEALRREVAWAADVGDDPVVVLTADGRVRVDDVGQRAQQRVRVGIGPVALGLGRTHVGGQGLRVGEQHRLLVTSCLRDLAADRLLLGAEDVVRGAGPTTRLVGVQQLVHELDRLTASPLRRTYGFGVFTQESEVDHAPERTDASWWRLRRAPVGFARWLISVSTAGSSTAGTARDHRKPCATSQPRRRR
jgi:hypothetical protein